MADQAPDEEGRKKGPAVKEYLATSRETLDVFRWMWRNIINEQCRKHIRLIFVSLAGTMFTAAFLPFISGYIFTGLMKHDARLVTLSIGSAFVTLIAMKWFVSFHEKQKEYAVGQARIEADNIIQKLFLEKSVAQHVHEDKRLSVSSTDKGRWNMFNLLNILLFEAAPTVINIVFCVIGLFCLNWVAGLIMFTLAIIYICWSMFLNYKVAVECGALEIQFKAYNRYFIERFERFERVKVNAKAAHENSVTRSTITDLMRRDRIFWIWHANNTAYRSYINATCLVAVMAWGAWLVWNNEISIGFMSAIFAWASRVSDSVWKLGDVEHQINWHMPSVKTTIEALSILPEIVDTPDAQDLAKGPHTVTIDNISHTYRVGEKPTDELPAALVNVSFTVKPGSKVAVIGPSGAGKSTIIKKMLRFENPTSGAIRVDGIDIRNITQASWWEGIGYIPQSSQIFDGSIHYNLTYGLTDKERTTITDEQLWAVMHLLKIDYIDRLTEGLDTLVGKNGLKLSGGQAQRLMIGAAVLKRPWLMVIDEATSSLDSTTEKYVQEGLKIALGKDVSAIIIAHRLSTIRHLCDTFVVLRPASDCKPGESQVEATAHSFEELYKISPTFRHLADDQEVKIGSTEPAPQECATV